MALLSVSHIRLVKYELSSQTFKVGLNYFYLTPEKIDGFKVTTAIQYHHSHPASLVGSCYYYDSISQVVFTVYNANTAQITENSHSVTVVYEPA